MDRVSINSGNGDDIVFVGRANGQLAATINGRISIRTGGGNDRLDMISTAASNRVSVNTASGNDTVTILGGNITDRLTIGLGGGDDFILIKDITLGEARVNGNGGEDTYRGIEVAEINGFEDELILPC